jgi:hypothetical protein
MTKPPRKRGRQPLPEAERKDRLVQARVPENLDETLREEARKHRVSVSQLIRNVLEDTFHLVDDVVAQTSSLTHQVRRDAKKLAETAKTFAAPLDQPPPQRDRARSKPAPQAAAIAAVYAWQEVVLNRDTHCARCARLMARGEPGMMGLQDDASAPRVWLCPPCVAEL